jgi:hypothetical protein
MALKTSWYETYASAIQYDTHLIIIWRKVVALYGWDELEYLASYADNRPPVLTALTLMSRHVRVRDREKGIEGMARWNPKPCVCFQRDGFGMIMVIGKEVVQFDSSHRLISRTVKTTYYEALQEVLLMVGASQYFPLLGEAAMAANGQGVSKVDMGIAGSGVEESEDE